MRREFGIFVVASAAAIAVVVAVQTGRYTRGVDAVAPPPVAEQPTVAAVAETAPRQPPPPPTPTPAPGAAQDPSPALRAEITRLTTLLAEREAAYDRIARTLSGRGSELERLTGLLAERDADLTALRAEIETLRAEAAFDAELTALKSDPDPSAAPTEAALAEAAELDVVFDAGKAPAEYPPQAGEPLTAIHFDPSSSRLSPGGRAHAAAAAVTLADMGVTRIRIVGYTDRVGGPARNRALAEARARAVAAFLIDAGLPGAMIETAGMGEADLPVTTDDGVAEPLNRCVEIVVTPL